MEQPRFEIGQKVTLNIVPDNEMLSAASKIGISFPRYKAIYSVRKIGQSPSGKFTVWLEEIINPRVPCGIDKMEEPSFPEHNFEDASTLSESRMWAELMLNDLKSFFDAPDHKYTKQEKDALIGMIMGRIAYLKDLSPDDYVNTACKLIDMNYLELELLDEAYEIQVRRKMNKDMGGDLK